MIEILEHIKKLDESGNYRLADKLDNEVRKIYSQTLNFSCLFYLRKYNFYFLVKTF